MTKTLLMICFLIFPAALFADENSQLFWVVGSFTSPESAQKELRRLEYRIRPIRIAAVRSNSETRYRLLIDDSVYAEHNDALAKLGIKPWRTKISPSELSAPMVTAKLGANLSYVLVLAGFRDKDYAEQHAEKLKSESGKPVRVIETTSGDRDYYRVVSGPYDAEVAVVRDQFVLMGIDDAWWLNIPKLVTLVPDSMVPLQPATNAIPVSISGVDPIPVVEASVNAIPEGTVLRAPMKGESYIDYCVKKANGAERAQYCADGEFISQLSHRVESMGEAALFKFCATEATGMERRIYCDNDNLAERSASQ